MDEILCIIFIISKAFQFVFVQLPFIDIMKVGDDYSMIKNHVE